MRLLPIFTTVTPLSKALAMLLFITFPFAGFWLGIVYEKAAPFPPIVQPSPSVPIAMDSTVSATNGEWKTYKNETYGFAFQHPDDWRVDDAWSTDSHLQLQQITNGQVESIIGSIQIINKAKPTADAAPYVTMYTSRSTCPTVAGEIPLGDTTNVYCHTGKELPTAEGVWKGAVECSATGFYGLKNDPESCPHQFWIDTKKFFTIVHLNYFEPIQEGSVHETLFNRFLSSFRFTDTAPSPASATDTRCTQIPDPGSCRARFPSYYFDQQSRTCKEFFWGGCGGIRPFQTMSECLVSCEKKPPALPPIDRWPMAQ